MRRVRKIECDSFDEVLKIVNDLYQRIGTLTGQKSAKGVKDLQKRVVDLEASHKALQEQLAEVLTSIKKSSKGASK